MDSVRTKPYFCSNAVLNFFVVFVDGKLQDFFLFLRDESTSFCMILIGIALSAGFLQQVELGDEQFVVLQLDSQITGGLTLAFDEEIIQFA